MRDHRAADRCNDRRAIWAERYDRDLAESSRCRTRSRPRSTAAITPADRQRRTTARDAQTAGELRRVGGLSARTMASRTSHGRSTSSSPSEFFQQAIELDPTFAGGYSGLAAAQLQAANTFMQRDLTETLRSAETLARKAVSLRSGACRGADLSRARAGLTTGDYQGARSGGCEQAIALNPNLAIAHGTLRRHAGVLGHPREGLVALEHGLRLDPRHPRARRDPRTRWSSGCISRAITRAPSRQRGASCAPIPTTRSSIAGWPPRSANSGAARRPARR